MVYKIFYAKTSNCRFKPFQKSCSFIGLFTEFLLFSHIILHISSHCFIFEVPKWTSYWLISFAAFKSFKLVIHCRSLELHSSAEMQWRMLDRSIKRPYWGTLTPYEDYKVKLNRSKSCCLRNCSSSRQVSKCWKVQNCFCAAARLSNETHSSQTVWTNEVPVRCHQNLHKSALKGFL